MNEHELQGRRDALAQRVAQMQFDLGGLTYEMAIRDHFRVDVLVRRSAAIQQLDAELGEVERLLALRESATVGGCSSCGALHGRGAVYCWQCGRPLVERTVVNGDEPTTAAAVAKPPPATT